MIKNQMMHVADSTLNILKAGEYPYFIDKKDGGIEETTVRLQKSMDDCVLNTKLYSNNFDVRPKNIKPVVEVINQKTTTAAINLFNKYEKLVALNFASARSPGGGWLRGAKAQEEDLTRCSALYYSLLSKQEFYDKNNKYNSNIYTDDIIYSPNVPFFKNDNYELLENYFDLSIITAAAPNVSEIKIEESILNKIILERAIKILKVASINHKNIILGAWGCGAFGNNPIAIANIFNIALTAVPNFEYVCFAVYDNDPFLHNFNAFKDVFCGV